MKGKTGLARQFIYDAFKNGAYDTWKNHPEVFTVKNISMIFMYVYERIILNFKEGADMKAKSTIMAYIRFLESGFFKLDENRAHKVNIFKQNTIVYQAVDSIISAIKQLYAQGETFEDYYALQTLEELVSENNSRKTKNKEVMNCATDILGNIGCAMLDYSGNMEW